MDLRGIQYDRGYSRMIMEDHQLDRSSIRAESSRLRSIAWTAFYRFKLTSPDQQLTNLATRAVEEAFDVADASDREDLKKRANELGYGSMSSLAPQPVSSRPRRSCGLCAEMTFLHREQLAPGESHC
jgi:hypothetical protein